MINKYNYKALMDRVFDLYTRGKITKETYIDKIDIIARVALVKVKQSTFDDSYKKNTIKEVNLNKEQFTSLA